MQVTMVPKLYIFLFDDIDHQYFLATMMKVIFLQPTSIVIA